jgi:hypothetical protein
MGLIRKTVSVATGAVGVPVVKFRSAKEEAKVAARHQKKRRKEFERRGMVDPEAVRDDVLKAQQAAAAQLVLAEELERLADLRDRGILSKKEFQKQKSKLIDD